MTGIYQAGYYAGYEGHAITSCPWPVSEAKERAKWMEGFRAGSDRREVARTRRFR